MKFIIDRLQRFFQLPPGERVVLMQAWGLFFLAELALRILPLRHLLTLADKVFLKPHAENSSRPAPAHVIARMAWLVDVAGRYVPVRVTCLMQALVLSWLLGRRGIATTLRIGVARREGDLTAHAWLELNGRVILGLSGSNGYVPLFPRDEVQMGGVGGVWNLDALPRRLFLLTEKHERNSK